jgi:hypothetical protein
MSDVAVIRAAIKAKLLTVADIGVVNDTERYTDQMSALKVMYVASIAGADQLRGWHIRKVGHTLITDDLMRWAYHTRWRLRLFMALNDANESEKAFDDLIEAASEAFRLDDNLGGAVLTSIDPESNESGLQLEESEPVLFAGVLCHSAKLSLHTQHLK